MMSIDTDASELSPRQLHARRLLDAEYQLRHYPQNGYSNGMGKMSTVIMNSMLGLIVVLLGAAIIGQVNFNNKIVARLSADETAIRLILEGRIK
jgi:hypothetical protein